jgi:hypothetical protein
MRRNLATPNRFESSFHRPSTTTEYRANSTVLESHSCNIDESELCIRLLTSAFPGCLLDGSGPVSLAHATMVCRVAVHLSIA